METEFSSPKPEVSMAGNLITILMSLWLVSGVFIDGCAFRIIFIDLKSACYAYARSAR
jgi:hypothetical protein